jgi:hypothetical protein
MPIYFVIVTRNHYKYKLIFSKTTKFPKNRKYRVFYFESILGISKMDKKNVQNRICQKSFPEIHVFAA